MEQVKYSLCFIFNKSMTKIGLIRKNRPGWQKGKLNGIGGHIEYGESFRDGASREVLEESGIYIEPDRWEHIATLYNKTFLMEVYCVKTDALYNIRTQTDEAVLLETVSEIDYKQCISNLRWLIGLCLDDDTIKVRVTYNE